MVKLLYYGWAVEPTLLGTLGSIAADQSKGTRQTEAAVHQFLDSCATHPHEKLPHHLFMGYQRIKTI